MRRGEQQTEIAFLCDRGEWLRLLNGYGNGRDFFLSASQKTWTGSSFVGSDPNSHRNLGVFGSMYYNVADSEAISYSIRGGIVKAGTFKSREHDTAGLALSPTYFTSKEVANLTGLRTKAGGQGQVPSSEWNIELNYGYELAPGIVLRPNLQYFVHPDSRYTPSYPSNIPNAFVMGLQINANPGTLFSLPQLR